jgi:hypothetical protein
MEGFGQNEVSLTYFGLYGVCRLCGSCASIRPLAYELILNSVVPRVASSNRNIVGKV